MPELNKAEIEVYLKSVIGLDTRILNLKVLGKSEETDIKAYGYGTPVQIDYECEGKQRRAVLHTISAGPFGHEHMSDRAQMLLWDHKTFNLLPRHVRSIDAGAFRHDGSAVSVGDTEEFFVLTEYAEGRGYVEDVTRMRNDPQLREIDVARADPCAITWSKSIDLKATTRSSMLGVSGSLSDTPNASWVSSTATLPSKTSLIAVC
jgi:hypothetical protein